MAEIDNAGAFKGILESIKVMIKHANFQWTDSGISMQSMDSSHVCLVRMGLDVSWFKKFECGVDFTMGAEMDNFSKIMTIPRSNDSMTILKKPGEDFTEIGFVSHGG